MFNDIDPASRINIARRFAMFLISTAAHLLAVVILVMLPLIFIGAVPEIDLISFLIAAPEPPPASIPPVPPSDPKPEAVSRPLDRMDFDIPDKIPKGIPLPAPEPEPIQSAGLFAGLQGNFPAGVPVGVSGGTLGNLTFEGSVMAPLPPPPKPTSRNEAVRRGGEVQSARLIRKVDPVYPYLAIVSRVSGMVVLDVKVDEDGNVESIRVLSGHPLLRDAAVEAVRQWKYSATILNGEPVPVVAAVTVIFNLR